MQQATRNRFALYSQSVQAIFRAFLGAIQTTHRLRKEHPEMRVKYPWRMKRFYPLHWPAQAVCKQNGQVILPMGKGRKSLVLPLDLPDQAGACSLYASKMIMRPERETMRLEIIGNHDGHASPLLGTSHGSTHLLTERVQPWNMVDNSTSPC